MFSFAEPSPSFPTLLQIKIDDPRNGARSGGSRISKAEKRRTILERQEQKLQFHEAFHELFHIVPRSITPAQQGRGREVFPLYPRGDQHRYQSTPLSTFSRALSMFCSFVKKGKKKVEKFVRLANQSRRHSAASNRAHPRRRREQKFLRRSPLSKQDENCPRSECGTVGTSR